MLAVEHGRCSTLQKGSAPPPAHDCSHAVVVVPVTTHDPQFAPVHGEPAATKHCSALPPSAPWRKPQLFDAQSELETHAPPTATRAVHWSVFTSHCSPVGQPGEEHSEQKEPLVMLEQSVGTSLTHTLPVGRPSLPVPLQVEGQLLPEQGPPTVVGVPPVPLLPPPEQPTTHTNAAAHQGPTLSCIASMVALFRPRK